MNLQQSVEFYKTAPDVPMEVYIFVHSGNGSKIATARDTIPALRSNHSLTLADWYRLEGLKTGMTIETGLAQEKVRARILYGRWLVDCPVCRGANDVDPAEAVYLCSSCYWPGIFRPDRIVPAHFAAVEFPGERAEIERLLLKRPYIRNRNWNPGETIADLVLQNLENGCEV